MSDPYVFGAIGTAQAIARLKKAVIELAQEIDRLPTRRLDDGFSDAFQQKIQRVLDGEKA